MEKSVQPDYTRIYSDIISRKYPEKEEICRPFLIKKNLSSLEIIKLNELIFDKKINDDTKNGKYRSYSRSSIIEILSYQKSRNLNNTELAKHFKLSRNTVAKWKKIFLI